MKTNKKKKNSFEKLVFSFLILEFGVQMIP